MKKLLLIMLVLAQTFWVYGQAGKNDLSFNGDLVDFGDGPSSTVYDIIEDFTGNIILVGQFGQYHGVSRNKIVRINQDGTLDNSFDPGSGANNDIWTQALQPDGKVLIGGIFTSYNGRSNVNRIARINPDGKLDLTFNSGVGPENQVNTIAVQSNGKILIGGAFTRYQFTSINRIARLNSDGSLDNDFNVGLGANSQVNKIIQQSDGKILLGGFFTSFNGVNKNHLVRLNSDGSIDETFLSGLGTNGSIRDIAILPDGKILIAGSFTSYNGILINRIALLNSDGSLDLSLDPKGSVNNDIYSISIQSDGNIVIAGSFTTFNGVSRNRIARLYLDGGLDNTFNPGSGGNNLVRAVHVQNNGHVLIGGAFTFFDQIGINRIAKLNTNGNLDTSFNQGTGFNDRVRTIAIQEDKKILTGGFFSSYNGQPQNGLSRLNSDGSLDDSFKIGQGINNLSQFITKVLIQPDNKILISGNFSSFNGVEKNRIARLNSDGSIDQSFFSGGTGSISTMCLQPDGKILIGGTFITYAGISIRRIARLNQDGTLDSSFNPGTGTNGTVESIKLLPDGRILIGGDFTNYNGFTINRLARLNSDGSLDLTFDPGEGPSLTVTNINIQKDGKILISGNFQRYDNIERIGIARILSNGKIDGEFNPILNPGNRIHTLNIQPDSKILIGGEFSSVNSVERKGFARLNSDGTVDLSFDTGEGATGVFTSYLEKDGKILVGGSFVSFDNVSRVRITRLLNDIGPEDDKDPPIPDLEILPLIEAQCVVNFEDLTIPTATDNEGEIIQGTTDESIFPIITQGSTTITWTYTDANGNSSTQTQEIQIKDTELPEIQAGNDTTVESDEGLCEAMLEILAATATDNCEVGEPTGIRSDGEPLDAPYPVGVTTITWNVTDVNGNEAEPVEQTITVVDVEKPVIFAEDLTLTADSGLCSALINLEISATDNCGVGEPTGVRSDGEPLDAPYLVGVTTISWDVADIHGNEAETVIQAITVTDDETPKINTKNAIIELQAGSNYSISVDEVDDGSTDNCGIASRTLDKTLFTEEDEGDNVVTLTIVDNAGNENSAQATVTVIVNRENECVVALAKDIVLILDRNGTASIRVNQIDDGSFTNCSNRIVSRELEKSVFTCADLGEQFVGFKAIDRDGNVGETKFKVTVLDETAPRIGNVSKINVTLTEDEIYILPDLRLTSDASENCAVIEYIQIPEPGTVYTEAGTYSILLRAIDGSGNVGERSSTLSIRQSVNNRLQNGDALSTMNTFTDEQNSLSEPESNSIKIYPNPAIDNANISVSLKEPSAVEIRIFDASGRLVLSEESVQEESFVHNIPMNGLSNGLYHVVVKINHQYLQGRLIKK